MGDYFYDIKVGMDFLNKTLKPLVQKNDQYSYIK